MAEGAAQLLEQGVLRRGQCPSLPAVGVYHAQGAAAGEQRHHEKLPGGHRSKRFRQQGGYAGAVVRLQAHTDRFLQQLVEQITALRPVAEPTQCRSLLAADGRQGAQLAAGRVQQADTGALQVNVATQ